MCIGVCTYRHWQLQWTMYTEAQMSLQLINALHPW